MSMGEPPEWELVSYLTDRFQGEGIPTRAIGWNPGDWISVDRGRADRMVYERASRSAEKSYSLS